MAKPASGSSPAAARRRARQAEIVSATRALFDARGVRDANIDDIAKAVGINRTIVYRHVASKEELFVLTLAEYLGELGERIVDADGDVAHDSQFDRLQVFCQEFTDFCLEYPAFPDCALALMRSSGDDLLAEIGESALLALGRPMGALLGRLADLLRTGNAQGDFAVADPDLMATVIYTHTLGMMQVARLGFIVHESAPGVPAVRPITPDEIRTQAVAGSLALVRKPARPDDLDVISDATAERWIPST